MEANFYIRGYRGSSDPSFHIGKAHWKEGENMPHTFEWAMNPSNFLDLKELQPPGCSVCNRPFSDPENCIEDDYGRTYTLSEFKEIARSVKSQVEDKVGLEFI